MDDTEREQIIELLRHQFDEMGEPELAELADYTIETEDGWFRPEPLKRLLKMLDAFEVVVALEDKRTYERAMQQIQDATGGSLPRVEILTTRDAIADSGERLQLQLYDQSSIRERLRSLRSAIEQDGGTIGPGETEL